VIRKFRFTVNTLVCIFYDSCNLLTTAVNPFARIALSDTNSTVTNFGGKRLIGRRIFLIFSFVYSLYSFFQCDWINNSDEVYNLTTPPQQPEAEKEPEIWNLDGSLFVKGTYVHPHIITGFKYYVRDEENERLVFNVSIKNIIDGGIYVVQRFRLILFF